jgi:hypothetical protein
MNTDNKKKARLYSHAFDVAFEITTPHKNPNRIPLATLRQALRERADRMTRDAVNCYDQDGTGHLVEETK